MALVYAAFVACVVLPAAAVPPTAAWLRRLAGRDPIAPARRWRAVRTALAANLGAPLAAFVVTLAGLALTVAVCWPLGELLADLERPVDIPAFDWARAHQRAGWVAVNDTLTLMGNVPQVKVVCAAGIVLLTAVWLYRPPTGAPGAHRGYAWVPATVVVAAFGLERYAQTNLARVVDRGHPPTTLGTYPSGGVGRMIAIYGAILALSLVTWRVARRWRLVAWAVLAGLVGAEAYTRVYLLKHWLTDVIGALPFGLLMLVTLAGAVRVLVPGGVPAPDRGPVDAALAAPGAERA